MTLRERQACLAALEAAERAATAYGRAAEALRAVLAVDVSPDADMVPLAAACRSWGISKDAGLKRARRGGGRKIAGRWHVPARSVSGS